jgi:aldehyde dehydrogenase (NAD+)
MTQASIAQIFQHLSYGPAPESAGPALDWIRAHQGRFEHWIDGAWRAPAEGDGFTVKNPATAETLATVAQGSAADVDAAVAAARAAQGPWEALSDHARARHLYALARELQKHARLFAVLESLDNGKPIRESRDLDIPLAARHFYHHAGWAQLRGAEFPDHRALGVVGQIIPWNFPLLMVAWKVAPALAAGNTVVLKPAEFTPLTALLFAEVTRQAGLPPGVFNLLTGDGATGRLLVEHPDLDKIAFTGSTEVGRLIRQATAGSGKKLTLELGGKSPFIVFPDADLDAVVEGVVDAIWLNQGQVCCAGSRLLVQEGIAEALTERLRARMETLRQGSPLDKAVDLGVIVDPLQLARIHGLVTQGVAEGGRLWQPSWASQVTGCAFPPTLVTEVAPASTLAQVEVFGPVLAAMSFRTPAEAVALANNTPYGLAASVWTESLSLALDLAPKLKAGVVWVNCSNLFDAAAGFGGYRESGFGREGGREGMWDYLRWPGEAGRLAAASVDAAQSAASPGSPKPAAAGEAAAPPAWAEGRAPLPAPPEPEIDPMPAATGLPPLDRSPKLYIGGRQLRPDSGYSRAVTDPAGGLLGLVGEGNRKDIRNAVEAAHAAAAAWAAASGHARAQILYYVAENLAAREEEFAARLAAMTGADREAGRREVEASIARLFSYAAWADKHDGAVHQVPIRGVTLAMNEPIGVIGLAAPEAFPLLGLISLAAPAIAMGNTVVALPSEAHALAATDLYTVLEFGAATQWLINVLNIVTGPKADLARVLAEHLDVDAAWWFGDPSGAGAVELASAGNLKRTWCASGDRDWPDPAVGEGPAFLRQATQVKNIWVPYGE